MTYSKRYSCPWLVLKGYFSHKKRSLIVLRKSHFEEEGKAVLTASIVLMKMKSESSLQLENLLEMRSIPNPDSCSWKVVDGLIGDFKNNFHCNAICYLPASRVSSMMMSYQDVSDPNVWLWSSHDGWTPLICSWRLYCLKEIDLGPDYIKKCLQIYLFKVLEGHPLSPVALKSESEIYVKSIFILKKLSFRFVLWNLKSCWITWKFMNFTVI